MPPRRSFLAAAMTPPASLRIGVVDRLPGARATAAEQQARLADTAKLLEDLGHVCEPVQIDYDAEMFNESSIRLWAVTLTYFMDEFARITGREIGPETCEAVTREIYRFGHSVKAVELEKAMAQQNQISRIVGAVMRRYDVLLTPGLVRDVARLGEFDQNAKGVDMRAWWQLIFQNFSAFTPLFNTTGQPALMLPLWQAKSGLPLAMQFVGRSSDEETLYSLAGQLEQALPWSGRRPSHYA
jgi:amidase